MANDRAIKKRVGSIKNIGKITRAMELVAASKVQKAEEHALNSKPYAQKIRELVAQISSEPGLTRESPFLKKETVTDDLNIVITSNRGLAGSLNSDLLRFMIKNLDNRIKHSFITVGAKGRNAVLLEGDLIADFSDTNEIERIVGPLLAVIVSTFVDRKVQRVNVFYNDFITLAEQKPTMYSLLPISPDEFENEDKSTVNFSFEPSRDEVLGELLSYYLETELRATLLQAQASEFAARMVAMKNAADNSEELSRNLAQEYNKIRQQSITNELLDVVTSSMSMQGEAV